MTVAGEGTSGFLVITI